MEFNSFVFVGDYYPESGFCQPPSWQHNAVVANLETVIADAGAALRAKAYTVILDSRAYEHIAASRVCAFNIANNHVYDAGAEAFERMLARLESIESIQFYGIRERPHADIMVAGKRCAVIGCLEPCRARGPRLFPMEDVVSLVREIRQDYDKIYVTPHWGKESEMAFHPSPAQRRIASDWIAAGVDGVFGHHSHTIHGAERINNRPVYYSLGNYQFDHIEGHDYPASYWGMAVELSLACQAETSSTQFFLQQNGSASPASDEATAVLASHLHEISQELKAECSTRFGWARAIGKIYLTKNGNSWRKRLKSRFLKTLPLWAVWNLLPQTILFRIASLLPPNAICRRLSVRNIELTNLRCKMTPFDNTNEQWGPNDRF